MSDTYIDYWETAEYGAHLVSELQKLLGATVLVDVAALQARVQAKMDTVAAELQKAGLSRSNLRTGRQDTGAAATTASDAVERFYYYLRSLPASDGVDMEAFFPGKVLGNISRLKPADVKAKTDAVLLGFDAPANISVAALTTWKTEVEAARDGLAAALKDKGSARGSSITGTAALAAAREEFLTTYNGVAKKLVQGVLNELGRADEYPLFFLDLQVHEGGAKKPAAAAPNTTASTTPPAAGSGP